MFGRARNWSREWSVGKSKVTWKESNLIRTSGQYFPKLSKTLAWNISFPRKLWVRKDEECSDCLPVSHPTSVHIVPEEKMLVV